MVDNKEQFKNYRVNEIIGRGRFAIVYKAEKLDVRKTVALKVLNPEYASRTDIRDQFREQAKQQAKLSYSRIVRVEDLREEHGQFFVAMEYMPLGSLINWITQKGMLSFRQVAVIIADIGEALDHLHGRSLVHGDVKPGNILLMEDPTQTGVLRAKLSDLRLPMTSEISQTVSENLIEVAPEYISPEQAGGMTSTPLSDQYSLGVVAYEMLCGQPPFTNKSQVDLYIDHQRTRPPSLQQRNEQVTPELEQVVLRALEKSQENRYASCGEFARALRAATAATEQKRFTDLLVGAGRLLEQQEFEQAYRDLKDALLIQPENEKAIQLMGRLEQQEGLSKNYRQAVELLQQADAKALAIRKAAPDYPDDANYLNTFAPSPPPGWRQLRERWKSAGQLAGLLLLVSVICLASITAWIDVAADQSIQQTIVAMDRTSTPLPTPTPFGGGNGKIAFSSNRGGKSEIYVMDVDGSNLIRLTNNDKVDTFPVWSPDGQKIAFYSFRDGNTEIYVMNADGSNPIRLTNNDSSDIFPAWSPDGEKIAFYSFREGNGEIYVMNADGSNLIRLTQNPGTDSHPAWSPDGQKIAFTSFRSGSRDIYVMDVDGSNALNLTQNSDTDDNAVWSPDGQKIAFTSDRDGNTEIYVMNADGSNALNLTQNSDADDNAVWSPDGQKIAFTSNRDGNTEIYVMNADGSNPIRLTNNDIDDDTPSWLP